MSNQTILRISKEITSIQRGTDLSIAVACRDSDIRSVKALVIGPPDTPYEYGLFEFSVKFGPEYPSKPPVVNATTTNKGRCRFNPNIYAQGKVCLSILGTWPGEASGEEWSSAQGLESVLISIQSLMSDNPYENEPGFETRNTEHDKKQQVAYVAKIRHETIRIAVIHKLEAIMEISADGKPRETTPEWASAGSEEDDEDEEEDDRIRRQKREELIAASKFEPFADLYKRRFFWYYETYLSTCEKYLKTTKDGSSFVQMPFESVGNSMEGTFQYTNLIERLARLKDLIESETSNWAKLGVVSTQQESGISTKLKHQYQQLTEFHKNTNFFNMTMELEDGNPFLWILTYFGRPSTSLEGGVFKIRIAISPSFPDEQPRVRVETPIFHHRVAKEGTFCYFPNKPEDMQEHVRAIIDALEEESPPYDPRTIVRPEATKLLYGNEQDKKKYKRQLRRSAEESMELES